MAIMAMAWKQRMLSAIRGEPTDRIPNSDERTWEDGIIEAQRSVRQVELGF